eukprot:m.287621 g.287621  ORF g.287621 m.287621 type:complete len:324 (-) comp19951_c0_seq3:68-1039(-)
MGDSTGKPAWAEATDLAASAQGGKVLFVTDQWFASGDNLIQTQAPEWKEGVFTEHGKWMDGWESRRKRTPGHDWALIRLGVPGRILGFDVDTSFFTGNYPPQVSIEATRDCHEDVHLHDVVNQAGHSASTREYECAMSTYRSQPWTTLVGTSPLRPGYPDTCHNYFAVQSGETFTHVRLNMHPDGGIARLRVYGVPLPDFDRLTQLMGAGSVDLTALRHGGRALYWSDTHYGHPANMLRSDPGKNMGDGWETARASNRPAVLSVTPDGHVAFGHNDWCVLKLGCKGVVTRLEIDTSFFKGNYPESCRVEACLLDDHGTCVIVM